MDKEFVMRVTVREDFGEDEDMCICLCGNLPGYQGFHPCDAEGNDVEPQSDWKNLILCEHCGRVINQDTLEVVGRKKLTVSPSDF